MLQAAASMAFILHISAFILDLLYFLYKSCCTSLWPSSKKLDWQCFKIRVCLLYRRNDVDISSQKNKKESKEKVINLLAAWVKENMIMTAFTDKVLTIRWRIERSSLFRKESLLRTEKKFNKESFNLTKVLIK